MSLTNLEEAVLAKAKAEADAILQQARAEGEARWERESARLREEHERRMASMRAALQAEYDAAIGARQTEIRLKLLAAKNQILDELFARATEEIRSLPERGYERWLKEMLLRLPKDLPLRVAPNEQDRELLAALLKELPGSSLTLADEPAQIKGGFIVEGEACDLDYSLDALMDVLKESMTERVAKMMFGGE